MLLTLHNDRGVAHFIIRFYAEGSNIDFSRTCEDVQYYATDSQECGNCEVSHYRAGIRPGILNEIEKQFAESGKPLPAKVYISFGALESDWAKPAEDFHHLLLSRKYEGLSLTFELLDGETHLHPRPRHVDWLAARF